MELSLRIHIGKWTDRTLFRFFLQQYQAGLEEIDQIPTIAVIEDEYLDNYYQGATDAAEGYYDVTNRLSTFYSTYSEYLDGSPPCSSEILDELEPAATLAKYQKEDMEAHDEAMYPAFHELRSLFEGIRGFLNSDLARVGPNGPNMTVASIERMVWFNQLSASENMRDILYNQIFRNPDGSLNEGAVIAALNNGGAGLPDAMLDALVMVFSDMPYAQIVNIAESTSLGAQIALQQIGERLSTMFTENAIAYLWGENIDVDLESLLRRAQLFTVMGSIPDLDLRPGSIDLSNFVDGVEANGDIIPGIRFNGEIFYMSTLNGFLNNHYFLAEVVLSENININTSQLGEGDGEIINQIMEFLLSKGLEKALRKNPIVDGAWSVVELINGINQIIQNAGGSIAETLDPNAAILLLMQHLRGGAAWVQTPPDGNMNVIGVNTSTPEAMINIAMLECMGYSEEDIWMFAFTGLGQVRTYTNPQDGGFHHNYVSVGGIQGIYMESEHSGDDDTFVTNLTDLEALQRIIDEREPVDWEAVRSSMGSENWCEWKMEMMQ